MAEEKVIVDGKGENLDPKKAEEDEFYLGSWKDKEAAEEGLSNLQSKYDSQGNEVGALRKQVEFTQQIVEDLKATPAPVTTKTDAPNYDQEMAVIQADMAKLDPVDDSYHTDLMALMNKSNALSRKAQHEETLTAATKAFKTELDDRDVKTTHASFYKDNPDFNTPEMQMRIKDYIAKDTTGMSDPLVAYREIQRDDAAATAKTLTDENVELKRLIKLAGGVDKTGTVVIQGQSSTQQKTNIPKATGADLDKGMQERLNALQT